MRGNHLANHKYLVSDGVGPYFSSPTNIFPEQQSTPPTIWEIRANDYGNSRSGIKISDSISPYISYSFAQVHFFPLQFAVSFLYMFCYSE